MPMQARLRGALDGRAFDLPNPGEDYQRLLVGRAIEAKDERHVALPEVEETLSVSRRHAEVRRTATGGWEIADAGSRGGTRVDGRVVPQGVFVGLRNGSHVRLGNYDLIFELDPVANPDRSDPGSGSGPARRRSSGGGVQRQMGALADAHRHRVLWLEVYPEDEEPKAFRLGLAVEGINKTWLIGRRQNAEVDSERYPDARAVTLPDVWAQLSVSREHALVRFKSDGRVVLENLSSNGTVVRGRRLKTGQSSEIEFDEEFVIGTLPCSLRLGASAGEASTQMPRGDQQPFDHLPSVMPAGLGFGPTAWSPEQAVAAAQAAQENPETPEVGAAPPAGQPAAAPQPVGQREPTESKARPQNPTRKDNQSDMPPPPAPRTRRSSGQVRRPSRVDIARPAEFVPDPAVAIAAWGYLVKPGEPATRWALRSWRTRLGNDALLNDILVEGPLVQPQHAVLEWRRRSPKSPPEMVVVALAVGHPVAVLPNGPKSQSPIVAGDVFVVGSQTFQLQVVGHPADAPAVADEPAAKSLFGWIKGKLG